MGEREDLAYLFDHGVTMDSIAKHLKDGVSFNEIVQAVRLAVMDGSWTGAGTTDENRLLDCFKPLDFFQEEDATWLVPSWIPEGQITLLAADGGVGKTTLWCHIIAALSAGTRCVLDPPDLKREPMVVSFLTTEDSVKKKLARKLRLAGANMKNIYTPDFASDREGLLRTLKFGTDDMETYIRATQNRLYVFDPVQGFIPPELNMGSRNAMRDCLAPLISLGEETGASFLIVAHTNKRKGASGRDRIADSADLWDISRSVLMSGYTEEQGIRYLSNEKNNYAELQETMLFTIDDNGQVVNEGTSWKRDREYQQDAQINTSAPKREDCKAWIVKYLDEHGGRCSSKELEDKAKEYGYSFRTIRRAKDELKDNEVVKYFRTGGIGKEGEWNVTLLQHSGKIDFSKTDDLPF